MGLFSDKSADAYKRAAYAVQSGNATQGQRELNDEMAKRADRDGSRARAAREGTLDW